MSFFLRNAARKPADGHLEVTKADGAPAPGLPPEALIASVVKGVLAKFDPAGRRAPHPLEKFTQYFKFDPTQPRDNDGKWTDNGASNGGSSSQAGTQAGTAPRASTAVNSGTASIGGVGGAIGSEGVSAAQDAAKAVAGGITPLIGLPQTPLKLKDGWYVPGPIKSIHDAANAYMASAGLAYNPPTTYEKVDPARAKRIADAFDAMPNDPDDPAVHASYAALAQEVKAQWHAARDAGLKVDWITDKDPYAESPRLAAKDVAEHGHWWGYPTDLGYGTGDTTDHSKNPLLADSGEVVGGHKCCYNDLFRIVHDYFGHFKEGNGFRAIGEDNAWRSHAAMFSAAALPAMTSETRGQNSWVNFGPYAETNKHATAAETHYAPQKIGLLPDWVWEDAHGPAKKTDTWADDIVAQVLAKFDPNQPRDNIGRWTEGGGEGKSGDTPEGDYLPGIRASGVQGAMSTKLQWLAKGPKTVEGQLAEAKTNQAALATEGDTIQHEVDQGTKFVNPGAKERSSLERKIASGKDPGKVTDVVRAGFNVPTPGKADEVVAALGKHFEVADEGWKVTPAGYFDRAVMVRFKNGQVGEVQLWPPGMIDAKNNGGHQLYEAWRVLPQGDPKRVELASKMQAFYGEVRRKLDPAWQHVIRD